MKALAGAAIGAVGGWIIGYFVVVGRADDLGGLAEVAVIAMAPTAPDTILFMAVGLVIGGVVGLVGGRSPKKDNAKAGGDASPRGNQYSSYYTALTMAERAEVQADAGNKQAMYGMSKEQALVMAIRERMERRSGDAAAARLKQERAKKEIGSIEAVYGGKNSTLDGIAATYGGQDA